MSCRVVFTPEAQEQIAELYHYIAEAVSPNIAARYTEAIVSHCESLRTLPHRGAMTYGQDCASPTTRSER
ncbi:MAG: type II toxin-antitoxin system RelE/ParE family toxin [Thiobacillus sp.]